MDVISEVNDEGTAVMVVTHDSKVTARADRVIYLEDSNITDEIVLGKYEKKSFADRESKMMAWTRKQGF